MGWDTINISQPRHAKDGRAARAEAYNNQNVEAARIIAADPRRYAGVLLEWADTLLRGVKPERPAWRLTA